MGCPNTLDGVILAAENGLGAWFRAIGERGNWTRCSVDKASKIEDAIVCVSDHESWAQVSIF